ncbi:MFS transporter [Falsiroseomonas ponticola]|jgi:MFS family permease|uniref:MFS transporter n=1 Tax=Falsiroseomonas ponticola TaxID=2786951 RepID=UPI0019348FAB|nr:MFS transporter [Roseomonas ponticola]
MTTRPAISAGLLMTCAVLCAALAMGLRNSFGLFLAPMTEQNLWTASGFSFAIALQVLMNGISQPICGQLADRFGGRAVVIGGSLLYAGGILGMALATHLGVFTVFAGVIMGVAVSAAGMPVVISTLTRLLPESQRGRAAGLGTAGSSFGQFLVVPMAGLGIATLGWQATMIGMAAVALLMIPLSLVLAEPPRTKVVTASEESATDALKRAFRTPSFWFLFFGFFVCGLHISFLTTHLPGFVHTCGLPVAVGAGAISLIGLFNIVGSLGAGELTQRWKRRELLVLIYASRGVLMAAFMMVEKTTTTVLIFSAFMGVLYLSTVPPTIALVARNFGTRWLATIFGLVFLGHQIGGFTGAWLGGVVLDRTGNYDAMWWAGVAASAFAALIHLPVKDPPPQAVAKPAAA